MIETAAFELKHLDACVEIMLSNPLWQAYSTSKNGAQAFFEGCYKDQNARITIVCEDEKVVGFICYYLSGTFYSGGYIRSVGVSTQNQSQGIGKCLMDEAEAEISHHTKDIFLLSSDFNTRAHAFYEKRGYQVIGPLRDFAKHGITELIFWKSLIKEEHTD